MTRLQHVAYLVPTQFIGRTLRQAGLPARKHWHRCAGSCIPVGFAVIAAILIAIPRAAAEPPNVILCMGDDHGWEETGYYGHPHIRTPVLDEMAASGLRFDRFYAAHPSCSPTRGSVLTGRHPNRYGTFAPNWSIRPEETTIANLLGQAGYRCGHFGKWHLGPVKSDSPSNPGAMGFDEWLSHDNFFELNPVLSRGGAPPEIFTGESSEIIVDEAIRFVRESAGNHSPFLAVIWFGSPHEPYSGLDQDLALYDALPELYRDRLVELTSNETGQQVRRPLGDVLRERYAEITSMDRAIGKLRQALRQDGVADNTILWYCGDNGTPSSGQLATPLRGQKAQMYEGGVRVPGIIEWPAKISQPRVTDTCAVTSDMLPTLCAVSGIEMPDRPIDGIDLSPVIDGTMTERPTPICFWSFDTTSIGNDKTPWIEPALQEGTTPLVKLMAGKATRSFQNFHHPEISEANFAGERAITTQRYKLVLDGTRPGSRELFNLMDDPAELQNLVDQRGELADNLESQLRAWQESVLQSLVGGDYKAESIH